MKWTQNHKFADAPVLRRLASIFPTSFPEFFPTRPTERERERVGRVGENPGNEVAIFQGLTPACLMLHDFSCKASTEKPQSETIYLLDFEKIPNL